MDDKIEAITLKLAKGDREAFSAVFKKYYGKVRLFILSIVKDETATQDLVQDVFVKLWEKRRRLTDIRSLDDFLFIISRNTALDYFKKAFRKKDVPMDLVDDALMARISSDISGSIEANSELDLIRKAVMALPEKRRCIYLMSKIDGMSNEDIASAMGITKKTVENQLHLAKSAIKHIS